MARDRPTITAKVFMYALQASYKNNNIIMILQ